MEADTPRTNAECYDCTYRGDMGSTFTADRGKLDPYGENVSADFARTLERENAELRAQLASVKPRRTKSEAIAAFKALTAKMPAPMTWTEEDEARFQGKWTAPANCPQTALSR